MATLDDLFGGTQYDKRPNPPKFPNVGDFHDVVVTKEPYREQQKEVGGSWEPLWLEKQKNGKWKKKVESELIDGLERSKIMQIVIEGKLHATGEDTILYIDSKVKKDALSAAMAETPLSVGYAIRQTRLDNIDRSYGWKFQIAAPKGE